MVKSNERQKSKGNLMKNINRCNGQYLPNFGLAKDYVPLFFVENDPFMLKIKNHKRINHFLVLLFVAYQIKHLYQLLKES